MSDGALIIGFFGILAAALIVTVLVLHFSGRIEYHDPPQLFQLRDGTWIYRKDGEYYEVEF